MELNVGNISSEKIFRLMFNNINSAKKSNTAEHELSIDQMKQLVKKEIPGVEMEQVQLNLDELKKLSLSFEKEIRLSVNKELNRIIISIVDKSTARVIREFPCDEIQKLALYLKDVINSLNELRA